MNVRWTPEAREDLLGVSDFYESQRRGLGSEFCVQLGLGLAQVLDAPERWPELEPGIRRYRLDPFAHAIVYRLVTPRLVEIVAVFDLRRKPGSWRQG